MPGLWAGMAPKKRKSASGDGAGAGGSKSARKTGGEIPSPPADSLKLPHMRLLDQWGIL